MKSFAAIALALAITSVSAADEKHNVTASYDTIKSTKPNPLTGKGAALPKPFKELRYTNATNVQLPNDNIAKAPSAPNVVYFDQQPINETLFDVKTGDDIDRFNSKSIRFACVQFVQGNYIPVNCTVDFRSVSGFSTDVSHAPLATYTRGAEFGTADLTNTGGDNLFGSIRSAGGDENRPVGLLVDDFKYETVLYDFDDE